MNNNYLPIVVKLICIGFENCPNVEAHVSDNVETCLSSPFPAHLKPIVKSKISSRGGNGLSVPNSNHNRV